jgi:hypothetical protein
MVAAMALTITEGGPYTGRCPGCGGDDVEATRTLVGDDIAHCRRCGQTWHIDSTPAARRAAQQAAGGVSSANATGNPNGPSDAPTGRLDDLPDALTPKQLNSLLPGLDRDDLYARLAAYDDWRRTKAYGQPGLPYPPADLWDTMIPCHRFGGTMGHDGLLRGGRFMVPKAVVVEWFFSLRKGDAMGDDEGAGD